MVKLVTTNLPIAVHSTEVWNVDDQIYEEGIIFTKLPIFCVVSILTIFSLLHNRNKNCSHNLWTIQQKRSGPAH